MTIRHHCDVCNSAIPLHQPHYLCLTCPPDFHICKLCHSSSRLDHPLHDFQPLPPLLKPSSPPSSEPTVVSRWGQLLTPSGAPTKTMRELAEIIFANLSGLSNSSLDPSTLAHFYTLSRVPPTSNIPQLILELDSSYSLAGALLDREMSQLYRRLNIPFTSSTTLRPSANGVLERRETPLLGIDGFMMLLVGDIRANPQMAIDMVNLFLSRQEDIAVPEVPREAAPTERDENVVRVVQGARQGMRQRVEELRRELAEMRIKQEEERKRRLEEEYRRRRELEESKKMEREMMARREEMDRWMEMGRRRTGRGFGGDDQDGGKSMPTGMDWQLRHNNGWREEEDKLPPRPWGTRREGSRRDAPPWMGMRMGSSGMIPSGFMDMGMNMGFPGMDVRMEMGSWPSPLTMMNSFHPAMTMDMSWMDE